MISSSFIWPNSIKNIVRNDLNDTIKIGSFKTNAFYHFQNFIAHYSKTILIQKLYFNPKIIDAGNSRYLSLKVLDSAEFCKRRHLRLPQDTNIVIANYDFWSTWTWGTSQKQVKISGDLKLLKWNSKKILIDENLKVVDYDHSIFYNAVETFKYPSTNIVPLHAVY